MAKIRRGRPINGVLIVNKPTGQSSNRTLQIAKRLFNAQKAGHTGSLDPLATGVLPLCFGESTKFSQFLLDSDKSYRATFLLGVITDSGDADGKILEQRDASAIDEGEVARELARFAGEIEQVPSMFSALKHQGQPLYKLARQGIEVERKVRRVTIFEIAMEAFRSASETGAQPEVDVFVHCSKGTYIRSIAEDLGLALGCGAHVIKLHRVQAGPFDEQQSVSLDELETLAKLGSEMLSKELSKKQKEEQKEELSEELNVELSRDVLEQLAKESSTQSGAMQGAVADAQRAAWQRLDALLLPVDSALLHLPKLTLDATSLFYMLRGQAVQVANSPVAGLVRMYSEAGELIGMGEMLDDGRVGPKRLISTA